VKRYTIFFLLIIAGMIFILPGCKKEPSFNSSSAVPDDYIGTWRGTIRTFKDNERKTSSGDLTIMRSSDGSTLRGIMMLNQTNLLMETKFSAGLFYFYMRPNDSLNPSCLNWNMAGFAKITEAGKISINIAGNECGDLGFQFVKWEGELIQVNTQPDPETYYSFASSGNQWNYRIIMDNGDTCTYNQELACTGINQFQANTSSFCSFQGGSGSNFWESDPAKLIIYENAARTVIENYFRLDALENTFYSWTNGVDTLTVTLEAKSELIDVPAGSFKCARFRQVTKLHSEGEVTREGLIWINNAAGIVRYESIYETDATYVKTKVLVSKNF
jgi:hypothetical protein